MTPLQTRLTRRGLFGLSLAGASLAALGLPARAAKVATKARILIIGAGAAGTALVNRLVQRLEVAEITIIDARAEHLYQPGFSLVAAGLKPASYTLDQLADEGGGAEGHLQCNAARQSLRRVP